MPASQRWYGGLYGAQADLVAAQVHADELDDAVAQMGELLQMPAEMRTSRLVQRARRLQGMVAGHRYRGSAAAGHLSAQAEVFMADANAARALPGSAS